MIGSYPLIRVSIVNSLAHNIDPNTVPIFWFIQLLASLVTMLVNTSTTAASPSRTVIHCPPCLVSFLSA